MRKLTRALIVLDGRAYNDYADQVLAVRARAARRARKARKRVVRSRSRASR